MERANKIKTKTLDIALSLKLPVFDNEQYIIEIWANNEETRNELRKLLDNKFVERGTTYSGKNVFKIISRTDWFNDIRKLLESNFEGEERTRLLFYKWLSTIVYYYISLLFSDGGFETYGFTDCEYNYELHISAKKRTRNSVFFKHYPIRLELLFEGLYGRFEDLHNEFKEDVEQGYRIIGDCVSHRDEYEKWAFNSTYLEWITPFDFIFDEGNYSLSNDRKVITIRQKDEKPDE
jgi:hypothetical protein